MNAILFNQLSGEVGQYFTKDFVGAEALTDGERSLLTNILAQKRVKDFSTGRFCARRALAQIELPQSEILRKHEREPQWPEGIVGSISHSAKMVGAVVCKNQFIKGIGLDIETIGGVKPEMWRLLFTPNEQDFLKRQANADMFTTLFFSLKESFYKMQYPLLQAEPDFLDVDLHMIDEQIVFKNGLFDPKSLRIYWQQFEDQLISIIIAD